MSQLCLDWLSKNLGALVQVWRMAPDSSFSTPIPGYMVPSFGLPPGESELDIGLSRNGATTNSPLIESPPHFRYKGGAAGSPLSFWMLESEFLAMGGMAGLAGAAGFPAEGTQVMGKAKTQAQHAVAIMGSNNIKCDDLPLCTTMPNISHSQVIQSMGMAAGFLLLSCLNLVDNPYLKMVICQLVDNEAANIIHLPDSAEVTKDCYGYGWDPVLDA